jgi:hypothetical protein
MASCPTHFPAIARLAMERLLPPPPARGVSSSAAAERDSYRRRTHYPRRQAGTIAGTQAHALRHLHGSAKILPPQWNQGTGSRSQRGPFFALPNALIDLAANAVNPLKRNAPLPVREIADSGFFSMASAHAFPETARRATGTDASRFLSLTAAASIVPQVQRGRRWTVNHPALGPAHEHRHAPYLDRR